MSEFKIWGHGLSFSNIKLLNGMVWLCPWQTIVRCSIRNGVTDENSMKHGCFYPVYGGGVGLKGDLGRFGQGQLMDMAQGNV